jgi:hypothetical protein
MCRSSLKVKVNSIESTSSLFLHEKHTKKKKTPVLRKHESLLSPFNLILSISLLISGGNTSHRTNFMFVQRESLSAHDEIGEATEPLAIPNSETKKKMHIQQNKVTPYKTIKRGNPNPHPEYNVTTEKDTTEQRERGIAHATARMDATSNFIPVAEQQLGAYSGFQASLADPLEKNEAYYHITFPKPPSKSVVNEVMSRCVTAALHKNMPFIQLVGDQPVYAIMFELKAENPEKFRLVLPILGGFHTQCAFLSAINKRFAGSGLEELIVAAGLLESGSVDQALRGKHYNRAMRVHKLVYECLLRLLIKRGTEACPLSSDLQRKFDVLRNVGEFDHDERSETMQEILESKEFKEFVEYAFTELKSSDTDMGLFWMSYLEMVEILLMNYHAMRTQNWDDYLTSLRMMQPWMAIYDNLHYTRYMTVYWANMNNLDSTEVQYMRDVLFSASMSGKPFSALPLDQWIETGA